MAGFTLFREKKESIPLLRFKFGNTFVFATLTRSPVSWQGGTYIPEPGIDVKLPKQGVNLDEGPCVITLPLSRALHPGILEIAQTVSRPRACPDLEVDIINLLKASEDEIQPVYLYSGRMDKSKRNPSGKKDQVELEFLTELHKDLENISLGRRADPECDLIFGKIGCYKDNSQFFANPGPWYGQVRRASVTLAFSSYRNSREVQISLHLPSHPGINSQDPILLQPRDWWVRSFLVADGADDVRIPIQEWRWDMSGPAPVATNTFVLNRVPPLSWETPGRVFLLVPDCPRTPQACMDRNNINNFGGLGFGIPDYNPALEVRDG